MFSMLYVVLLPVRFGLFEAMSAIEIMDPKMDAGMICNRKPKVLQFDEAVQVCLFFLFLTNILFAKGTKIFIVSRCQLTSETERKS